MRENEQIIKVLVTNDSGSISKVVVEPWADGIDINQNDKIEITGVGPMENSLIELEYVGNSLIVYGWKGSLIFISINKVLQITASKEIASI